MHLIERLRARHPGLDPVTAAEREGLSVLLWEEVRGQEQAEGAVPDGMPTGGPGGTATHRLTPDQWERLRARAAEVTARNLLLIEELTGLLGRLAEAEVPVVPVRGPVLSERLHGDPARRPAGDLDLLVRTEDLDRLDGVLKGAGYADMDRRPGFARAFYYTTKYFRDRHGPLIVEPHWSLAYPPFLARLDMGPVWGRTLVETRFGVPVRRLAPDDELLHLALHRVHHGPAAPLLWDLELDRYVRRLGGDVDWARLAETARASGQDFFLRQALEPLWEGWGTPLPEGWLEALPAEPPASREGRIVRLLASSPDVDGRESLATLLVQEGFGARLRLLFGLLCPTPVFMRLQYGLTRTRQLPGAYLRRFLYFGRMGLKGLLRLRRRH